MKNLHLLRMIGGAAVYAAGIVLEKIFHVDFIPVFLLIAAYIILGGDVVFRALKNLFKGQFFDENFLMSLATIGAFLIGETTEAVGVMLFYQIGEYFQEMAVDKSKKSITSLMDIRPDYANLLTDDGFTKVSPEKIAVGDFIIVKPGEKIPLDGIVTQGSSMLDTSALTGESVPRNVKAKDAVLSGCVNKNGLLTIEVTKTFGESTVSKIIDLVENSANKKAKTENFITRFARFYTPIVVILALFLAVTAPLFFGAEWKVWIHRALVFLVISCPCALVLSIPMGFFAGIGKAAGKGILIKGGNFLEAFNNIDTIVFDKTGTLTKGVFKVTKLDCKNNFSENELLELAAYAESFSNHPIALSVKNEYLQRTSQNDLEAGKNNLSDYSEISGLGVSVLLDGKLILAGNKGLMEKYGVSFPESQEFGTKVYIAKDNVFAGCIIISDEIKKDSAGLMQSLKDRGVRKTVMLTGDDPKIANEVGRALGLDEVYSGLLPQDKVRIVEELNAQKLKNGKLAFAGDGINDAPVLAMADVGVAMGALGSDAAIEAADVVLMTDEPSKLLEAMNIARFTKRIVWQNIIFALSVKVLFLGLGALGFASMWEAVFADVGVALLAVLNAMRILYNKKL